MATHRTPSSLILLITFLALLCQSGGFTPSCVRARNIFRLFSTVSEDEVKSMRIGEMKSELESYGISTKSFFEKSELVNAVIAARKEGKTPKASSGSVESSTASTTSTTKTASDTENTLQAEIEACKVLKVGELKSELEALGVRTNTFLEKSEFVRALAEARVDGVPKTKKKKRRVDTADVEEVTAAKVEVITNENVGPRTKKTRDGSAGAGNNPFGGGGSNPFGGGGGGGGMGGIEDMLKNMGGTGGGNPFGNSNPFAGAGGGASNPFGGGNPMEAAQQAMNNPKVRAVIEKAQKNPKVMKAVQESMGNPMNMAKYMQDPEVGPILKELQEAMMG